ncbi:organic cation transporter protein-like [Homarus americanus]|uniref:organic cation transporter protein-like n=1 Tax=Homarus americanus TaxID=6706 RepID=UPI001C458540|nr:organic cation transporter protein-like [Homarus americanus]
METQTEALMRHSQPTTKEFKNFDSLLTTLGVGRWTLLMFGSYFLWALLLPYFSLGGAFYNPAVDHWCRVPQLDNSSWTLEQRLNYSIPREESGGRSQCRMFVRDYGAVEGVPWTPDLQTSPEEAATLQIQDCDSWQYDTSIFSTTVSMEWDLVCGKASLSPFFQSFYFFGTAVGEPLMGFIADRYGRRRVVIASTLIFVLTATSSALVPLYSLVLAGRFVLGMIHPIIGPSYIQGMEACPAKLRTVLGLLSTTPFAITGMLFGMWAYFIRDWRNLQLLCTFPVAFLLLQIPFMDESPRWLMMQERYEEATKILRKAARWQGVSLPQHKELVELLNKFKLENEAERRPAVSGSSLGASRRLAIWWQDITVLVRTTTLRRITIGLFGCWFCTGLTYWGMSLSGTTFSNDPFLYMVLSSLMEIPGYSGFTPVVARFGRRLVLSVNFAVCAAAILTILVTPSSYTWMIFSLALVGKLFITGSYGVLYLAASELFPTCVRSRGLSLSSLMARLGSIVSPFIIKVLAASHWWAPSVMFGVCAAVGSLMALLLPESNHKPMPDTVEQLELLYGSRSSSTSSIGEKGAGSSLNSKDSDCEEAAGV